MTKCKKCGGAILLGISGYGGVICICDKASPLTDTVTIPKAEYDAMVADSERYRLIRNSSNNMRVMFGKYPDGINIHDSNNHLCGIALDQAIDSAKGK